MSTHRETGSTLMETRNDLGFHLHRAARGPGHGHSAALTPLAWHLPWLCNSVSPQCGSVHSLTHAQGPKDPSKRRT